jgi:hypothetical protein
MAKKKQQQQAKKAKQVVMRVGRQLDDGARKWLALLADPCNADLVPPCYGGTGVGYLVRTRQIWAPNVSATDLVAEVTPSYAAGVAGLRWGWSATAGGSLGNVAQTSIAPFLLNNAVGRYRAVAGCVTVLYTGTELERKGTVSMTLDSGTTLLDAEPIGGNAYTWAAQMPTSFRMGSTAHEYRWVPSMQDSEFVKNSTEEVGNTTVSGANTITLVVTNATPGTFQLQITFVWEWQPEQEGGMNTGLVTLNRAPASRNSLPEILGALGNVGKFAFRAAQTSSGFLPALGNAASGVAKMAIAAY